MVPIADPPSSEFGYAAAGVLWYPVTYLWLVLLSPLLLRLYRTASVPAMLLPLAGLYLADFTIAMVLLAVAVLALGWVAGVAARRGAAGQRRALRRPGGPGGPGHGEPLTNGAADALGKLAQPLPGG